MRPQTGLHPSRRAPSALLRMRGLSRHDAAAAVARMPSDIEARHDQFGNAPQRCGTTGSSHMPAMRKLPVVLFCRTFSDLQKSANQNYIDPSPPRQEGRYGRSSRNVRRVAMDAIGAPGRGAPDASDEAVWSWHPDAGVKSQVKSPRRRWLKSPVHRGEHGISRPTSRRECRSVRLYL
jgi:hypothetical protein